MEKKQKQKSNKAHTKCRRKEASEALKAETPVPKEADQKRSRLRQMPCCNSPLLPSRQQKRPCSADRRSGTSRAPCRSYGEVQIGFASRRPPSSVMARGRFFCLQCPFPFVCSLCTKQAEQGSKTLCVFNAFCLNREQVKQELVFLNTIFLSKRNIGWWAHEGQQLEQQDHQEGKAATIAAAKAAGGRKRRRQQQQHGCLCWWHTAKFSLPPVVSSSSKCSSSKATPHGP